MKGKQSIFGKLIFISLVLALGLSLATPKLYQPNAAGSSKVYLKKTSGTINAGSKATITVKKKKGVKITKKKFTSSNKKVASVSSSGKVKGIKTGKATIKVKVWYSYKSKGKTKKSSKTLKYKVTVKKKSSPGSETGGGDDKKTEDDKKSEDDKKKDEEKTNPADVKFTFGQSSYTVKEGETVQVKVTANKAVDLTWETTSLMKEPSTVRASIDQNGVLTANRVGSGYVKVTDKKSGATAYCRFDVTENSYTAKYTYDVKMLNDLYVGGELGTYKNNPCYAYVKTDNPGDCYVMFEISGTGANNFYFRDVDPTPDDLNYELIPHDNPLTNGICKVNGGFLKGLSFSINESATSWTLWEESYAKAAYQNCGGKITLNLYEYNKDAPSYASKNRKKVLVWSKEIEVRDFYSELEDWINNILIPEATKDNPKAEGFDKMKLIINYMQSTYFHYSPYIILENGKEDPLLLVSEAGPLWENRAINSEGSPLLAIKISNMVGYPMSMKDANGIQGHSTVVPVGAVGTQENSLECCPWGFAISGLPEKHNIEYFLEMYGVE